MRESQTSLAKVPPATPRPKGLNANEIEQVARKVLASQSRGSGFFGHTDVVGCIATFDGHLRGHPEVSLDGVLLPAIEMSVEGQWTLHYPAALPLEYFRVTAAIALGTVLLNSTGIELPCRIDLMEHVGTDAHWEAHQFALALLLPVEMLKGWGSGYDTGQSHSLAFSLGVPHEFLMMRFTNSHRGADEAELAAANSGRLATDMLAK